MKRILCLILVTVLLTLSSGCHYNDGSEFLEPVEFYYPRRSEQFVYGTQDGVLAAEMREASGHTDDLSYLIPMYLRGPQDEKLRSPFPTGCTLVEVRSGGNMLVVILSEEFTTLEGMELTLACASLARTCFSLTDAQRIRIDSSSRSKTFAITLEPDSVLLFDDTVLPLSTVAEPTQ